MALTADRKTYDGDGSNLVRFCFAKTDSDLDEACRRIERLS